MLDQVLERLTALPEKERKTLVREALAGTKDMKWAPNPGPQTDAYFCEADELFFGGQAGPGKTELGIGLAVNCHKRTLFLREFREDAKSAAERFLELTGSRAGWNGQDLRYRHGGKAADFGGCKSEDDKQRYKGDPHDLIVFDEVGDFSETQYTFIIAWNRSADPGQRCRVVATGNPPTRAKGMWIIKRWGAWLDPRHPNPAKPGELRWYTTDADGREIEVDGPGPHQVGDELVTARSRTFIRGTLADNPDLAATNYDATLAALPKELRAAYRGGQFDASLKDAPMQCIPTAWVRLAMERWTDTPKTGVPMCAIGVDCSGGGDDPMILAPRYDGWFAPLIEVPGETIPQDQQGKFAAGYVIANRRDKAVIVVDMGGGYGGPLYEHLRSNEIPALSHKGAEASTRRTEDGALKFTNKRTEVYWRLREALDPDQGGGSPIMLPQDNELLADLTTPTFEVNAQGIKLMPKEKVVATLGRSTNKGDAVVMSWSAGPTFSTDGRQWEAEYGHLARRPRVISGRHHARMGR